MTKSPLTPLEEELLKHLNNYFELTGPRHSHKCSCCFCREYESVKKTLDKYSPETDIEQLRRLAG